MTNPALDLNATLYLVNYAKKGTLFEDQILFIKVKGMNEEGIYDEEKTQSLRSSFKERFKTLN